MSAPIIPNSAPETYLRPAWNSSSRLGYTFDLSMKDGSDVESDDDESSGGRRQGSSALLTEDQVHNMRKFLTDENDAAAAASPLYDRWEEIDPDDRALRSDEFWGRWMVCTPPSYSTRPGGALQDKDPHNNDFDNSDSDTDSMEEWERMGSSSSSSSSSSPRRLAPLPSKLAEAAPELAAAAMSQQDNLVKKWNGSLRRANNSPRGEEEERPYCCECGRVEVANVERIGKKYMSHQLIMCKECDFIYCRDCWRLVHKYGTMRRHRPGMLVVDSTDRNDYNKLQRAALVEDLMSLPPEQTGIDGKTSFFDRMHLTMEENGRAGDYKHLTMPYGDSTLVVRSGVEQLVTPREAYVQSAHNAQFLPEPSVVRRGGGRSFNKSHFGLGPARVAALHKYLTHLPEGVEDVDLTDNRLTDDALAGVLRCLKNNKHLKRLRLSKNVIKLNAAKALATLLTTKNSALVDLDLSNCQINAKAVGLICTALAKRGKKGTVEKLNLSDNKIRGKLHAKTEKKKVGRVAKDEPATGPLAELVNMLKTKTCTITELSLSGNPLGDGGGVSLAKGLRSNHSLTALDLRMSGLDNKAAAAIGEALKFNKMLESLDVSFNRYGDRGATALAAGVRRNETLQNINASHTHISEKGVRSLLAAVETLAGGDDLARNVRLDGTDLGLQRFQQFDVKHCTGKYFLDLSNSYERAILMQMLRASKQHRNILWKGLPQINGNKVSQKAIESMHRGLWKPPRHGVLEVSVQLTGKRAIPEKEELDTIYKRVSETVKSSKGKAKLSTLAKLAANEDLHINIEDAQALLSLFNSKEKGSAMLALLPCLLNHEDAIKLAQKNLTKKDQVELDNSIGLVFGFSPINPTGRYRLDLNDFYQRLVAIRCLQISNDEGKKCRRSGGGDTSQHGNYMGFRNESIAGRTLKITHDHVFPPYRTLQFDFVSSNRAPVGTKQMSSSMFKKCCDAAGLKAKSGGGIVGLKNLMAAKGAASAWKRKTKKKKSKKQMVSPQALMAQRAKEKVEEQESNATTLRGLVYTSDGRILQRGLGLSESEGILMKLRDYIVKNNSWFSIDQALSFVSKLPPQHEQAGGRNVYTLRIDVLVALFARIVDHSDFCWQIMRTLHAEEQDELVHRLGWLKLFDPYHPEGLYKLNLERAEDRKMALLLLHVCAHEEAFFWKDTTMNSVPLATIPSSWSRGLPNSGRLILTIDKDPNVESEYESDSSDDDGYVPTPRRPQQSFVSTFARSVPATTVGAVDQAASLPALSSATAASGSGSTGSDESKILGNIAGESTGYKEGATIRKVIPQGGGAKKITSNKITFSKLLEKQHEAVNEDNSEEDDDTNGEISFKQGINSTSSSTVPQIKVRSAAPKGNRNQSKRRRRLTAMTRQYVMPSTLHGSLMMQDKWEQKRIKKRQDKKIRAQQPISYTQVDSSSSDESSDEEGSGSQVRSLLSIERIESSDEEEEVVGFQPDDTVFAGRIDVCDSENFYDDKVLTEMLEMDWERCIQEQPKVKAWFVKQHKKGLLSDAIAEAQEELFHELLDIFRTHQTHLYNSFDFYAVMGNGTDAGQIQMNQYSDWLDDCRITEANNVPQCNRGALDRVFIVTNREDDQEENTADANDDRALMRFEFLEVIMRIAIAKFIDTKKTDSVPAAVKRLLTDHIATNKGEGSCNALIDDPTTFRKIFVYTQETDKVLRKNVTMLNSMFDSYCRNSRQGMLLKEWLAMLKDFDLFNYDFTSREAKLAYVWSKSRIIDEVKGREKIHRMNFFDFMEGLLRIAQLKPLPAPEDITKLFMSKEIKEDNLYAWVTISRNPKKAKKVLKRVQRRSSDWGARQTRPHHIKLQVLMDVLRISADTDSGHTDVFQMNGSRPSSTSK